MRASTAFFWFVMAPVAASACGGNTNAPQAVAPTAASAAYPPGYPAGYPPSTQAPSPAAPGYAQTSPPPGYPTGYPTAANPYPAQVQVPPPPVAAPVPAPTATYAPPPASGAMATPGLLALPCQSDATCGLHRCNTQYSKCAFPCQSAADCVPSNQCIMGVCLPGGGS